LACCLPKQEYAAGGVWFFKTLLAVESGKSDFSGCCGNVLPVWRRKSIGIIALFNNEFVQRFGM